MLQSGEEGMSMSIVVYKSLFVWEAQPFILQAPSADIPCAPPCTFSAAPEHSLFTDISEIFLSTKPEFAYMSWYCS